MKLLSKRNVIDIPEFFYKRRYLKLFKEYGIDVNNILYTNVPEDNLVNFFECRSKSDEYSIDDLMYFTNENMLLINLGFEPSFAADIYKHQNVYSNIDLILKYTSPKFIEEYLVRIEQLLTKKSFLMVFENKDAEAGLREIYEQELDYVFEDFNAPKVAKNLTFFTKICAFKEYDCYETIVNYLTNLPLNKKNKVLDFMLSIKEPINNPHYVSLLVRLFIENETYEKNIKALLVEENMKYFNSYAFASEIYPRLNENAFKDRVFSYLTPAEKETTFLVSHEIGIGSIKEQLTKIKKADAKYQEFYNFIEAFVLFDYSNESFEVINKLAKQKKYKQFINLIFDK